MATEADIRAALDALKGVTKIIIAQRVSSVMGADLIVVIDDGRVHALGTHAELLANDTIYQEIYHSQMKQLEAGESEVADAAHDVGAAADVPAGVAAAAEGGAC